MHGTLNHLLTTDRIWMQRFTGEGDAPDRLDAILYDRLDDLRAARDAEDARIVAISTVSTRRGSRAYPLSPRLDARLHSCSRWRRRWPIWFNHQTHHRGQAHMLLTSLGQKAPELDLLYYQRLVEAGQA